MHLRLGLPRMNIRGPSGGVQKQNKRQRKLFEFNIPRTSDLSIRKRDGFKLQLNGIGNAIVIDDSEDEGKETINTDNSEEEEIKDEDLVEIVDLDETVSSGAEGKIRPSDHTKSPIKSSSGPLADSDVKFPLETTSSYTSTGTLVGTDANSNELNREVEVRCPICDIDLTFLEFYAREAHCESCLNEKQTVLPQYNQNALYSAEKPPFLAESPPQQNQKLHGNDPKNNGVKLGAASKSRRRNTSVKQFDSKPTRRAKRVELLKLPSFKILTFQNGFKLVVDGFNFAPDRDISVSFLSHFHSDHYIGLKKSWNQGVIYCSPITAALVWHKFKISDDIIRAIPDNEPTWITSDIKVTAFDANHCPGSQVYLFQEYATQGNNHNNHDNSTVISGDKPVLVRQFIHTGDFRANKVLQQRLRNDIPIDAVYLDTTYLSHRHRLPSQREVVVQTARYVRQFLERRDLMRKRRLLVGNLRRNKLILVGAYSIGKEKLAWEICDQLGGLRCAVYNDELRSLFMDCGSVRDSGFSDGCEDSVMVHLVPLGLLKDEASIMKYLKEVVKISWLDVDVVGIVPTGWTYDNIWRSRNEKLAEDAKRKLSLGISSGDDPEAPLTNEWFDKQTNSGKKFQIFKVPYSEHSSFDDLVNFATCGEFKWNKIIATVNLHDPSRVTDMQEWFRVWKPINDAKYSCTHTEPGEMTLPFTGQ